MKRFRRYIFNTLTVVSVLLLLGVVGLWVDSYWTRTAARISSRLTEKEEDELDLTDFVNMEFVSIRGQIVVRQYESFGLGSEEGLHLSIFPAWHYPIDYRWERSFLGFGTSDLFLHFYGIPHWFLTLIFTTLPTIWLFKWNKRRKLPDNPCPSCGYDLTGNETGVCPECGVGKLLNAEGPGAPGMN